MRRAAREGCDDDAWHEGTWFGERLSTWSREQDLLSNRLSHRAHVLHSETHRSRRLAHLREPVDLP